jgi:NAD(P)-dependent dehydrogenase (short-subunit alcohol dehydrogenase family)
MKKVYIVTGAGHFPGIGSSIATVLASQHRVIVNARTFDSKWTDISQQNSDLILVPGDVRDTQVQINMIDQAIAQWSRIDGIIHNASPSETATYDCNGLLTRETWSNNLQTNLVAVYELSLLAHKYLLNSKGSIVCIGSRSGQQAGTGNNIAYGTAKAAMHHLTRELALLLSPVRVNAVSPGLVVSQRLENILQSRLDSRIKQWQESSLSGEIITPEDIASSIVHLLDSKNITGQILNVCGGASIQPPFITVKPN